MQQQLWGGAVAAILLAVISGFGERRRQRRRDLDQVGFVPWVTIQMFALLAAALCGWLALGGQ